MKYGLLALALLAVIAGQARPDYVIFIVNAGHQVQGKPSPMPPVTPGTPGTADPNASPLLIPVVIEVDNAPNIRLLESGTPMPCTHRFGGKEGPFTIKLVNHLTSIPLVTVYRQSANVAPLNNAKKRFTKLMDDSIRSGTKTDVFLDLADRALGYGFLDDKLESPATGTFGEVMKKLASADEKNLTLAAFRKLQPELAKRVSKEPTGPFWGRIKPPGHKSQESAHYSLIHSLTSSDAEDVLKSYLNRLENNLRSFYYWFMLRGISLPLPAERLMVVLATTEAELKDYRDKLSAGPKIVDGFYAPRDKLLVLSTRRTDLNYDLVAKMAEPLFKNGMEPQRMLKGLTPTLQPGQGPVTRDQQENWYQAQEFALILKHMDMEGERATISHDATRQLLYTTGLLPRNVETPEWLLFGMASFFETPLGAAWGSFGQPNSIHLPAFRDLKKTGKLEGTAYDTMVKVITDGYFRQAVAGKDKEAEMARAQATAWSLGNFLMRKELAKLQAYCKELGRMPRDLELDEEALLGCFARAFDAWDNVGKVPDRGKLETLANRWYTEMLNVLNLEAPELLTFVADKVKEVIKHPPQNPMGNPAKQ